MLLAIIIIGVFGSLSIVNRFVYNEEWPLSFKGRLSVAVMLVVTSAIHFIKTDELVQMLPENWPYKEIIVYATGGLELIFVWGILYPKIIKWKSGILMCYLALWIPAFIIGTNNSVEFAGMQNGINNLYYKIPVQLGIIVWVYWFGIHEVDLKPSKKTGVKSGAAQNKGVKPASKKTEGNKSTRKNPPKRSVSK